MVLLGVFFTNLTFIKNEPLLVLDHELYPKKILINNNPGTDSFIQNLPSGFDVTRIEQQDHDKFSDEMFSRRSAENNYGFMMK